MEEKGGKEEKSISRRHHSGGISGKDEVLGRRVT